MFALSGSLSPMTTFRRYYTPVAAAFVGSSLQYLSIASNADIAMTGDTSFWIGGWAQSGTTPIQSILWKGNSTGTGTEYGTRFVNSGTALAFAVGDSTATAPSVNSASFTLGDWVRYDAWCDTSANKLFIAINDGTPSETAFTGTPFAGSVMLTLGRLGFNSLQYLTGAIDQTGIWKRVPTAGERTALYNSGRGLPYSSFSAGLKVGLSALWEMEEASGNRADSHGSNTLTANGTGGVLSTTGIVGS